MYTGIFDTHAHYDEEIYSSYADALLNNEHRYRGVDLIMNIGSDLPSSERSCALAEKYDFFCAAVGVHPMNTGDLPSDWLDQLAGMTKRTRVVCIGEIGLDYFFKQPEKKIQQQRFIEQLDLAEQLGLPVNIHDRESHHDMLEILRQRKPKGVLHRFAGSPDMACSVVDLGMYIGVGPEVTFLNEKNRRESVRRVGIDHIVLETDAPFISPTTHKGEPCISSWIGEVAETVGELLSMDPQEVINRAAENGRRIYNI
ncbi:MAG: TatD family hydrolase [Lachnospiraceae bacterium]|nr:TatD family hydrolase [Oscillospiraceae bacterium]MBR3154520.1 TatD family hydrolase [Lachnospiraceae bacterium]